MIFINNIIKYIFWNIINAQFCTKLIMTYLKHIMFPFLTSYSHNFSISELLFCDNDKSI